MIWQKLVIDRAYELVATDERLKLVLPRFIDLSIDLASICDRYVPYAPQPQVDGFSDEDADIGLQLYWLRVAKHRGLRFVTFAQDGPLRVTATHVSISATDGDRVTVHEVPSHETISTLVRSFFDGWEPQS